jgi:hypothetical protein
MAYSNLTSAGASQANDVGCFLGVSREGLFHKDVAAGLEGVHGWAIVVQMRREDRKRIGRCGCEQFSVVGERSRRSVGHHGRECACGPNIRIRAADHVHPLECDQPAQMDPGRPATAGDPDPHAAGTHPGPRPSSTFRPNSRPRTNPNKRPHHRSSHYPRASSPDVQTVPSASLR